MLEIKRILDELIEISSRPHRSGEHAVHRKEKSNITMTNFCTPIIEDYKKAYEIYLHYDLFTYNMMMYSNCMTLDDFVKKANGK